MSSRPPGEPEHGPGQGKPEGDESPQGVVPTEYLAVGQQRPGPGVEEVEGHLVGAERGELGGQLGPLLERLPHPEDDPAADLHAVGADELEGGPAFLPGMGGDDLGEVGARGLEVVVMTVDAERGQLSGLGRGEDPQRAGDVDIDRLADGGDARREPRS